MTNNENYDPTCVWHEARRVVLQFMYGHMQEDIIMRCMRCNARDGTVPKSALCKEANPGLGIGGAQMPGLEEKKEDWETRIPFQINLTIERAPMTKRLWFGKRPLPLLLVECSVLCTRESIRYQ